MNRSTTAGILLCLLAAIAAANVAAHGQAKGIVLERHDVMVDIRDANKSIGNMVRGKEALDRAYIRTLAREIVALSEKTPALFPDTKASRHGKGSNATQAVWQDWDVFISMNDALISHARDLAELSQSAPIERLRIKHRDIGKTCKRCHQDFRKKRKH